MKKTKKTSAGLADLADRQSWPIGKLKRHPQQDRFFAPPRDAEIKRLAEDIRERGLQQPIEVTPDGTVVSGHSRWKAVLELGWQEVQVIVRHELADPMSNDAIDYLVKENANRRQLSALEKAHCAQRLIQNRCRKGVKMKMTSIKAEIAAELNVDLRTLNRYLEMTKAPRVIQHAFSQNLIAADLVKKVTQRPKEIQDHAVKLVKGLMDREQELGAALGETMKVGLKELIAESRLPRRSGKAAARLVAALLEAQQELDGEEFEFVAFRHWADKLTQLKAAQAFVGRFIKEIERTARQQEAA